MKNYLSKKRRKEIIIEVRDKLLAQGVPSTNAEGTCQYRGMEGTKCAIGHLILDHLYSTSIEGVALTDYLEKISGVDINKLGEIICQSLSIKKLSDDDIFFLSSLQTIHDIDPVSKWEHEYNKLLVQYENV